MISCNAGRVQPTGKSLPRQNFKARLRKVGRWGSALTLACALTGCLSSKPFTSAENVFTAEEMLPLAVLYPGKAFAGVIRRTALGGYVAIVKLNGKTWVAARQELGDVEFRAIDSFHSTHAIGGRTVFLINHREADDPDWLKGPSDGSFGYLAINIAEDETWSLLLPESGENEVTSRRGLYRAAAKSLKADKVPQSIDLRKVSDARFQIYLNEVVRSLGFAMGSEVSQNCDQGFAMQTSGLNNWRAQSLVWMGGASHTAFRSVRTREVTPGLGTRTKYEHRSESMYDAVRFTTIGHDPSTPRRSAPLTDLFLEFPHLETTDPANPMPKIIDIIRKDVEAEIQLELNGEPLATFPMMTGATDFETPLGADYFQVGIRILGTFKEERYGKLFERIYDAVGQAGATLTYRAVFGDGRATPTYATDLAGFDKADAGADRAGRRLRELCVQR